MPEVVLPVLERIARPREEDSLVAPRARGGAQRQGPASNGTGGVGRVDLAAARQRLEEARDELDRSVAVLNGAHQQNPLVADYPQDPADAGTSLAESDRAEAVLAAAKARRVLVLDALRRLDNGSYGVCVDCGKAVPEGRLEVKPEAARCLACQAKRDRMRR